MKIDLPKVYNLGRPEIKNLFEGDVFVQEELDGYPIAFRKEKGEDGCDPTLRVWVRGIELVNVRTPPRMYVEGVSILRQLDLTEDWLYLGIYLQTEKQSNLAYTRVPHGHVMVDDIMPGACAARPRDFLSYEAVWLETDRIGLECIPVTFFGKVDSLEELKRMSKEESVLGGPMFKGLNIKNYSMLTVEGWPQFGRMEGEMHKFPKALVEASTMRERWDEAIKSLRESGKLHGSLSDIATLVVEVQNKEPGGKIAKRMCTLGLPDYYKNILIEENFMKRRQESVPS